MVVTVMEMVDLSRGLGVEKEALAGGRKDGGAVGEESPAHDESAFMYYLLYDAMRCDEKESKVS